jgi:hypothetical protein
MVRGLEVRLCKNYRSYKKPIPALKEFPEVIIITFDDDILYPYDMVEPHCANEAVEHVNVILAHVDHKMSLRSDGSKNKYSDWVYETTHSEASSFVFPVRAGDVLHPPGC